jgi:Leucine-rich repeat (LRR) protein
MKNNELIKKLTYTFTRKENKATYLTSIPRKIYRLPRLEEINFSNNHISGLSQYIGEAKCLKTLILEGNRIKTLPTALQECTSLQLLNIANNPIDTGICLSYLRIDRFIADDVFFQTCTPPEMHKDRKNSSSSVCSVL